MCAELTTFNEHSQRIMAAILGEEEEEVVRGLLAERERRIQELTAAKAAGQRFLPEQLLVLEQQERLLVEAVARRRDEVGRALVALRHARSVGAAYRPESGRASRFIDREG